jgi:DNA modification methylase
MSWFEQHNLITTLLCWHKTNPTPLCNGKHLSDLEFIVYIRSKGSTFNNDTPFDYKRKCFTSGVVSVKNRMHTAQKPIELLRQYILLCSNEGDTVLDCFMGSGSTGVACCETNRNFIGVEIDKNYFDIAKQRIHDAQDQIKLF